MPFKPCSLTPSYRHPHDPVTESRIVIKEMLQNHQLEQGFFFVCKKPSPRLRLIIVAKLRANPLFFHPHHTHKLRLLLSRRFVCLRTTQKKNLDLNASQQRARIHCTQSSRHSSTAQRLGLRLLLLQAAAAALSCHSKHTAQCSAACLPAHVWRLIQAAGQG